MGDSFLVTRARGAAGKGKVFWLAPVGGGVYWEVPPQGPPPYPFIYHF